MSIPSLGSYGSVITVVPFSASRRKHACPMYVIFIDAPP